MPTGGHQVQVPLEDILQLASAMMSYLLAHPPANEPSSPPRKQQRGSSRLSGRHAIDGGFSRNPTASAEGKAGFTCRSCDASRADIICEG
jgi:hypothetical protein